MKTVNAYKIRVVLAGCILIVFAGISWAEGQVYFADQNLKAAVEEELAITDPNETDMLDLTSLDASNRSITDLTGLEYATNLTWLQLYNNQISDISPISALKKLEVLSLVGNQISDCCDLANLLTLTRLGLSDNQISDISCLSGLTELTGLFLYSNNIEDISPLAGLAKLIDLFIDWNRISDISPLNGLTELSGLHLADNEISDISPLANLEKLEYLVLWGNHISDINAVSGLTNLQDLALGDNQISNISVLSGLTNLRGLGLYRNQITDICALSGLTNLEGLGLSGNQICDINCLSELTKLTDLELGNNCISDISVLSGLINLRELWLYNNQISDCNVLSGLINLERLGLWTNQISDIAALAEMTKLTLLDLTVNPLNRDAYCIYLPIVIANNPNLTDLRYDPKPHACADIDVSPLTHDFGDVELGTSSTVIVTVSNVGSDPLTVYSIGFQAGSGGDFSITSAPALPAVVEPNGFVDVEITYTPSAEGYAWAVLEIGSDDPYEVLVKVELGGVGVEAELPPEEQIAEMLDFFDASIEEGTLMGDGPGSSAEKRLNALRNMIEAAGDLIEDELFEEACRQLLDAYKKTDGVGPPDNPPDFVTGEAAEELAGMINALITSLGCE